MVICVTAHKSSFWSWGPEGLTCQARIEGFLYKTRDAGHADVPEWEQVFRTLHAGCVNLRQPHWSLSTTLSVLPAERLANCDIHQIVSFIPTLSPLYFGSAPQMASIITLPPVQQWLIQILAEREMSTRIACSTVLPQCKFHWCRISHCDLIM